MCCAPSASMRGGLLNRCPCKISICHQSDQMWKLAKKSKKWKAELQILEALSGLMMSVDEPLRLLGADSGVQPQPIMVIGKLAIQICTYALVL